MTSLLRAKNPSPQSSPLGEGERRTLATAVHPVSGLCSLKILPQIHSGVEMRYLFLVTVEHERGLFTGKESGADHAFALLAPAWMIDTRIHVGVKTVLVRRELVPERIWLLGHKVDLRQRLRALKSVLPWHDKPKRCAILIAQRFPVKPDGDERQFVACFLNCEAFCVWPG